MRIAFVEWPDALSATDAQWGELKDSVNAVRPDILITNELPFGPWLADSAVFSEDEAHLSLGLSKHGHDGSTDRAEPASTIRRSSWRFRPSCRDFSHFITCEVSVHLRYGGLVMAV